MNIVLIRINSYFDSLEQQTDAYTVIVQLEQMEELIRERVTEYKNVKECNADVENLGNIIPNSHYKNMHWLIDHKNDTNNYHHNLFFELKQNFQMYMANCDDVVNILNDVF